MAAVPNLIPFRTYNRGGQSTLVPVASEWINHYVLTATVAESITPPTGASVVLFSSTHDFYANFNGGVAAIPAGDVTDGTGSSLNPGARVVKPGVAISVISENNAKITVEFYGNA